jgi:pyrroloquinoline quinone (PQQ) biosynthesis protein C
VDHSEFREALLAVMDTKLHWAWPAFTSGLVRRERLNIHLEQEYATYVRDFPVLVARAYVACPIVEARRELIANVYEEETGGLFAGRPHPDLFLEYPRGLGMDLERFADVELLPAARAYRALLDDSTSNAGWEVAAAVTTIFLEGTSHERAELNSDRPHSPPPLEEHPLVRHYGLPLEHLALTKAHRAVEGDHRKSAWRVILDFVDPAARPRVVARMREVRTAWHAYRDDVAAACGVALDSNLAPVLRD